MAARDFLVEQQYALSHHRLHNRLLHGWGIVCGLDIVQHPNPQCRDGWVVVRAGIGLDAYGREIVLHHDTAVDVTLEFDDGPEPVVICLRYAEQEIEPVTSLL